MYSTRPFALMLWGNGSGCAISISAQAHFCCGRSTLHMGVGYGKVMLSTLCRFL